MTKIWKYVKKLFRGEEDFWKVLWIWGVLYFIFIYILKFIFKKYFLSSMLEYGINIMYLPIYIYFLLKTTAKNKIEKNLKINILILYIIIFLKFLIFLLSGLALGIFMGLGSP